MNCIEVKGVSKRFGSVCALNHVDVEFKEHKIYGLLGRNGAGKSTLLNIISNRIFADEGQVLVNGAVAAENDLAQSNLFLMSEKNYYPEAMKVREAYMWTKAFYPNFDLNYAQRMAKLFQLNLNSKIRALSTGYQSIFKITLALSVNTPYILLDEPVLGLDANHRELFYKQVLQKYIDDPCTIIISTHLIEEISELVEDIIIIKDGTVIRNESRESLLSQGYTVAGAAAAVDAYLEGKEVIGTDTLGGLKTAYIIGLPDSAGVPEGLEITRLDLQKLFIQLTNS